MTERRVVLPSARSSKTSLAAQSAPLGSSLRTCRQKPSRIMCHRGIFGRPGNSRRGRLTRRARIGSNATVIRALRLTLPGDHAPAMHPDPTRLITFRDFLENRQGLECYCLGCTRTAHTDVAMLVDEGLGDRQVKRYRPTCRKCGSLGIWSFTGPLPAQARMRPTGSAD